MSTPKSFHLSPEVHAYIVEHSEALDPVAAALVERTAALGNVSIMQIAPEQATFMTALTRIVGVSVAVEVGTFTGFSSLAIARGLRPGGRLTCCDVSEEWTSIGREFWEAAGVADRIDLRIGPAADTLAALPQDMAVDLCFIDADKDGYITYWDELVPRLRPGGLALVDNTLYFGTVADPANTDETTAAIRAFNDHAVADERMEVVILPVGDGLTVARRRD